MQLYVFIRWSTDSMTTIMKLWTPSLIVTHAASDREISCQGLFSRRLIRSGKWGTRRFCFSTRLYRSAEALVLTVAEPTEAYHESSPREKSCFGLDSVLYDDLKKHHHRRHLSWTGNTSALQKQNPWWLPVARKSFTNHLHLSMLQGWICKCLSRKKTM